MSNIRLVIFSAFLFVSFISCNLTAYAEGEVQSGVVKKAVVVANVPIYKAQIVSQDNGVLTVAFDIANESDATQSNIQYGIDVIKKTDTGQTRADSFVSGETLSLAAHTSVHKEVAYKIPEQLRGRYEIWAVTRVSSGMMLGLGYAGVATFANPNTGVTFLTETCTMTVSGDTNTYSLVQGVDVDAGETLNFSCTLENHFDSDVTVTPSFTTNFRTAHGEVVTTEAYTASPLTLGKGAKQEVVIPIPKATTPQAYDVNMVLNDAQGKTVSNKVIGHYVLRGASATIQTATLDKVSYNAQEQLTATIAWSPSADSFSGSRKGGTEVGDVTLQITVATEKGSACIEPIMQTLKGAGEKVTITAPVTADCADAQLSVSLTDKSGKVLDSRTFPKPENAVPEEPVQQVQMKDGSAWDFWSLEQWILLIVTVDSLMILYILLTLRGIMRGEIKIEDVITKKN